MSGKCSPSCLKDNQINFKFTIMKHYMLFIREDLDKLKTTSEEDQQKEIGLMMKWVEDLSTTGNFVSGEPLEPEVRLARENEIVHSGPFIELKEGVSGYMVIAAENIDQAAEFAQGCHSECKIDS
jgi:hypothetical protein